MPTHLIEKPFPFTIEKILDASQQASSSLCWQINNRHQKGMTIVQTSQKALAFGNPVTIVLNLHGADPSKTIASFTGNNFGFGPLQSNYVKQVLQEFAELVEQFLDKDVTRCLGAKGSRNVLINNVRIADETIEFLERLYTTQISDGAYWYDRHCGAWGQQGGATLGFIQAGLDLGGPLQADASCGDTGVFINGRQLHQLDVIGLQQLGPVVPGRYWVDALGNVGFEGGMMIGNLWLMARQRTSSGSQGGGPWAVHSGGGVVMGDGQGGVFAQFGDKTWSNW
jgi:hypothetical protein